MSTDPDYESWKREEYLLRAKSWLAFLGELRQASIIGLEQKIRIFKYIEELELVFERSGGKYVPDLSLPLTAQLPVMEHAAARVIAYLEAHPDWEPTGGASWPGASWMLSRLLEHLKDHIETARRTRKPEHWGTVTREATTFFEYEIRSRLEAGGPTGRGDLMSAAFKPGAGALRMGQDVNQEEGWHLFARGLLIAAGTPVAHGTPGQSESFAMGIAGALSAVLTALDEAHGPPQGQPADSELS